MNLPVFNPDAWKSKIDPDFDILVKATLRQLREMKDYVGEGDLECNEEFLKILTDSEGAQPTYDGKEFKEILAVIPEIVKGQFDTFATLSVEGRKESIEGSKKLFISLTEGLSEESKKFYSDKIEALFNGTLLKPYEYKSEQERAKIIKHNSRELGCIIIPLFCRKFIDEKDEWTDAPTGDGELLKDPSSLSFILGQINSIFALIAYQTSIEELLKKGDDSSLIRAVTIDKGLLNHEILKRRILRANLSRDTKFLKLLGRAIPKKPLSHESQYYEAYIILRLFWPGGLYKLYNEELHYFLESCDLVSPDYPYALEKFVKRYIHPLYRNQ